MNEPIDRAADYEQDQRNGDHDYARAPQAGTDPDEPPKDAVQDYQLLRAVDLIRGISLYSSRN